MSLKLIRLIHLPRGLSYNQVRITSHKKNGVVQQIIHKDKRAQVLSSPSFSTDSVAGARPLPPQQRQTIPYKTERFNKQSFFPAMCLYAHGM